MIAYLARASERLFVGTPTRDFRAAPSGGRWSSAPPEMASTTWRSDPSTGAKTSRERWSTSPTKIGAESIPSDLSQSAHMRIARARACVGGSDTKSEASRDGAVVQLGNNGTMNRFCLTAGYSVDLAAIATGMRMQRIDPCGGGDRIASKSRLGGVLAHIAGGD